MLLKNGEKFNSCKYENRDNRFTSKFLPPSRNEFWATKINCLRKEISSILQRLATLNNRNVLLSNNVDM